MGMSSVDWHTIYQYITTICENNISNRALVAGCGKINTNQASTTNWGKILTNRGSSSCYNSEQQLLQIGDVPVITNRGKIITNWRIYYKLKQNYYKSRLVLQIGSIITNLCRTVICINTKAFTKFNRKQLNILEAFLKYLKNHIVAY